MNKLYILFFFITSIIGSGNNYKLENNKRNNDCFTLIMSIDTNLFFLSDTLTDLARQCLDDITLKSKKNEAIIISMYKDKMSFSYKKRGKSIINYFSINSPNLVEAIVLEEKREKSNLIDIYYGHCMKSKFDPNKNIKIE